MSQKVEEADFIFKMASSCSDRSSSESSSNSFFSDSEGSSFDPEESNNLPELEIAGEVLPYQFEPEFGSDEDEQRGQQEADFPNVGDEQRLLNLDLWYVINCKLS